MLLKTGSWLGLWLFIGAVGAYAVWWSRGFTKQMQRLHQMEPSAPPVQSVTQGPPALAGQAPGYSVVQASGDPIHYGELSQLMARATGMLAPDAATLLRKSPGNLLVSGLTEEAARSFVEALGEQGTPALLLPDAERMVVSERLRARSLEVQSDAVVVGEERLPLADCLLVQVGLIGSESQKVETDTVTGPRGERKTVTKTVTERSNSLTADLYVRGEGSSVKRWRVDARNCSFVYLGDRLESTSAANLRLVLGDLLTHCPTVFAAAGVKAFVEGQVPPTFSTEKDFNGSADGYLQVIRATQLLRG